MSRSFEIPRLGSFLAAFLLAVLAAVPAGAAPQTSGATGTHRHSDADAYVLWVGDTRTSTSVSVERVSRLLENRKGDVLWFRRGGKAFLIEDPGTLEQASSFFAGLHALEPQQEDLHRREKALEREERELDRQEEKLDRLMDLASGDDDDLDEGDESVDVAVSTSDADDQALEGRLREIQSQQRQLEARERELDSIERFLDAREEAIERDAESNLWVLIDSAVEKGLARPAPAP